MPLAAGMDYVPYDGFPAILHKGERVQTAVQARSGGGGISIDMSGGVTNVGQGVSRAEVSAAVQQANAMSRAAIMRSLKQQGVAA